MMNGHTGNDDEVCTRLLGAIFARLEVNLIQKTRTFAPGWLRFDLGNLRIIVNENP